MEKSQLDWGDLLYLYTLAHSDSLNDAAEKLEVNRTTVSRKIDNLEVGLGAKMLVKTGRELVLTEAGEMVAESASRISEELIKLRRNIRSRDKHLGGIVRVTATPRMCQLIQPALSGLLSQHPELKLEFSSSMLPEDLDNLESDIGLRFASEPPEDLIGRKLAEPASALYASSEFAKTMPSSGELRLVEGVVPVNAAGWIEETLGYTPRVVVKCNSTDVAVHALKSGIGVAYLPCYVGESESDLVRVSPLHKEGGVPDLWMLYATKHREVARIKMVADVIAMSVAKLKPVIEGQDSSLAPSRLARDQVVGNNPSQT